MEGWLDAGMGCCALAHPAVARYVQYALLHFHGVRYHVHAWCIMPNHVHVLIEPLMDLAKIVQGWKSYTARWVLARNGDFALKIPASDQLWMREYWDRYIRDAAHYENAVEYIHQNPVKAGLCPSRKSGLGRAPPLGSPPLGSPTSPSSGAMKRPTRTSARPAKRRSLTTTPPSTKRLFTLYAFALRSNTPCALRSTAMGTASVRSTWAQ
jgi:REP element-mobilizing transposase RayT